MNESSRTFAYMSAQIRRHAVDSAVESPAADVLLVMSNAAINLKNGNLYNISPATDARARKVVLVDGVVAIAARSFKSALELTREAAALGADVHLSGRNVYVSA